MDPAQGGARVVGEGLVGQEEQRRRSVSAAFPFPPGLAGGEGVRQLREILAKNLARATTLFQLLDVECATLQLEPTLATSSSLPTGVLSALLLTACLWARAPFAAAERVTLTGTRWLR